MSKYSDPGLEQMPDITQAIMREADAAADAYRAEPTRENRKRRALAFATVTASFTIESFGLEGLRKTKKDGLDQRMQQFREIVSVS